MANSQTKVILLVEDKENDTLLILRAFRKIEAPCHIVTVADGQQALDYLFGENPLPDIIILDLNLPLVRVHEVLRRLRTNPRTSLIPVVILNTSKYDEDIRESYKLGANAYLHKPVDLNELVETIRCFVDFWLHLNLVPQRKGGHHA